MLEGLGFLSTLFNIGSFAMNMFANQRKGALSRDQSSFYEWEAALNERIGDLNAKATEFTGEQAISAIAAQTKAIMSKQIVEFSNRGIELDGSPMLIIGDTYTMGSKHAQNISFNSQVQKANYMLQANVAVNAAKAKAEEAKFAAYGSMVDSVKGVMSGFNLLNSAMKLSSPLNRGVGGTQNFFANTPQSSPFKADIMSRMKLK